MIENSIDWWGSLSFLRTSSTFYYFVKWRSKKFHEPLFSRGTPKIVGRIILLF